MSIDKNKDSEMHAVLGEKKDCRPTNSKGQDVCKVWRSLSYLCYMNNDFTSHVRGHQGD